MERSIQEKWVCIQRQHGNTTQHRNEKCKMKNIRAHARITWKTPP